MLTAARQTPMRRASVQDGAFDSSALASVQESIKP
jgi:hypothetical protein